jgi:hypothetical protein
MISLARFASIFAMLLVLAGCNAVNRNQESLNNFAKAYVEYRAALRDAVILSWAVGLDQDQEPGPEGTTYYRRAFLGVLDTKATNRARAQSAREALQYFQQKSTEMTKDFNDKVSVLDQKSLQLVEAANRIGNTIDREQAVQVADSARKAEKCLETLTTTYDEIYSLELTIIRAVSTWNGNLGMVVGERPELADEKMKLSASGHQLRDEEQRLERTIDEQYATFKGKTNVTVDYLPPK